MAESPRANPSTAKGFLSLRLETHRLAEVRAFYRDQLVFPIREETEDSITFQAGATSLTFVETRETDSRPCYHFAFNIPENKLAGAAEWLAGRTPLAAEGKVYHFPLWNAHAVYFWDPAGNLGELIARHDLPNASDGPFVAEEILYASEIGLVVKDVPATVHALQERLGLAAYRQGSPDFQPVGDEHRLLLVAQEGRPWMDRPSAIFSTAAVLHGAPAGDFALAGYPYTVGMRRE